MALVTKERKEKQEKHSAIVAEFKSLIKVKGNQKVAVYEVLASKYGVSVSTVGRVVNK